MTVGDAPPSISRRELLAGLAIVSTAGCLERARSLVNRRSPDPISVKIKTLPADADETAVTIARRLQKRMATVGIDASIELMSEAAFLRDILLNHNFDLYVGPFPPRNDPDFLRATLHSKFVSEPGWQNPFGFSDLELDELLEAQRTTAGIERRRVVENVAEKLVEIQPFDVLCHPTEINVVRTDRFTEWPDGGLQDPLSYLSLRRNEQTGEPSVDDDRLRLVFTDARITKNLNPVAVEYRRSGTITGLIYDSLARRHEGQVKPWLAKTVLWPDNEETTATITLREKATWHDGKSVTASDVVFSYRFFDDTTLGEHDMAIPAPRFRGRTSLVESIEQVDSGAVRLSFGQTSKEVAERALTVPILPEHIWESKTATANVAGVEISNGVTEALVWQNAEPVGSGPLAFDSRSAGKRLVLSRFDDHFVGTNPPSWFDTAPAFDRLVVKIAPSDQAAVAVVAGNNADATGASISPVARETLPTNEVLEVLTAPSRSFYHVGYNTRGEPFGNVRFRRIVSGLLDPAAIVEEVLDGFGQPAATPLAETDWTPWSLRWDRSDQNAQYFSSDGDFDVSAAKNAFRDAGYRYNDEGQLVR